MSAALTIVIACGGTGGHLFPGLAVAEALEKRGHRAHLVVSRKDVDRRALGRGRRWPVESLSVEAMPRLASLRMVLFAARLAAAVCRCRDLYRRIQPAAVLSMGGFTAVAPVLAGRWTGGLPVVVHESNAVAGKANRLVARWSRVVAVGLAECAGSFPDRPVVVTGMPVRSEFFSLPPADPAFFGLAAGRRTVLVVGGSQGASALNRAALEALGPLAARRDRWQFLHLAGPREEEAVRKAYHGSGWKNRVLGFCDEMGRAYAMADVVVCRAGASTLAELAATGRPSVLVPYPRATDDHQKLNAQVFAKAGAARVLSEDRLDGACLAAALEEILESPAGAEMGRRCRGLAAPEAADRVADLVLKEARA